MQKKRTPDGLECKLSSLIFSAKIFDSSDEFRASPRRGLLRKSLEGVDVASHERAVLPAWPPACRRAGALTRRASSGPLLPVLHRRHHAAT